MTQFQSIGPSLVNAVQQNNIGQKKKQTQDRLNNPGNKTSLRDRRRLALINQGVDPDQLRRGIRTDRDALQRGLRLNRQQFREANRSGDSSKLAAAEAERARLEQSRYDINDRFKLTQKSLRDLPPDQQVARRAESRAQLNAQLPAIAANAQARETESASQNTGRLARIGREAYRLEIGKPPPSGMSDEAFAQFATTASPDVVNRVTNGVGLPNAPASGQADRLNRLAESGGVQFPEFTPSARQDDPTVIEAVRTSQAQDRLDRQAGLAVRGNQRDAAVAASERSVSDQRLGIARNANEQGRLSVEGQNAGRIAELELGNREADLENKRAQSELLGIQIQSATKDAQKALESKDVDLDVNLASSAVGSIVSNLGQALSESDMDAIDNAADTIDSMLAQYDGENLKDVASFLLKAFTEGGVDFGSVDIDSRSILGVRSIVDSARANSSEQRINSLIAKIRAYASGIGQSTSDKLQRARPGEGRAAPDGTRRFDRVVRIN